MSLSEIERAFAENLIVSGAVTGPRMLYPVLARATDARPLWDLVETFGLAAPDSVAEARRVAEAALKVSGPQAFSFSEGAMVGPWELVARRGQDIGGEAWYATQPDGSQACVRVVPPGSGHDERRVERFVERSNAGLDPPHPSILKIDEAEEDFGWLYTATRDMDCRSVASLTEPGALPEATALALAQSIAGSLAVVHDLGVVHGGLTPLAVLIREQRTYVSDFGVCSALLDGPVHGCRPGGRLGLLLYSSPELVCGDAGRGLDARDDLYGLGAVLYRVVCRVGPADRRANPEAPWTVEPPVSQGFRTILARLLCVQPNGRYHDARAVMSDLARLSTGAPPDALPPPNEPVRSRRDPGAQPQVVLLAETLKGLEASSEDALASSGFASASFSVDATPGPTSPLQPDMPIAVAPLPPPPAEEAEDEDEWEEVEEDDEPRARRHVEAPTARKRATARFQDSGATVATRKSGGWLGFFFALVLVLGGLGAVQLVIQPVGLELGRAKLAEAHALTLSEPVPYGKARQLVLDALPLVDSKPDLLRDAVVLYDALERQALAERTRLLPKGRESTRAEVDGAALELSHLRARGEGTSVVPLIDFDVWRAENRQDNHNWRLVGQALLAGGHPHEAAEAFERCGLKTDRALCQLVAERMVYLRPGPYLVPAAEGEGYELAMRPRARYLGRTEVTRGQYAEFFGAVSGGSEPFQGDLRAPDGESYEPKGWKAPAPEEAALPVTNVDAFDALGYAKWRGAGMQVADVETLVDAVRGPLLRPFPWGADPPGLTVSNAGDALKGPAPAGCFAGGAGPAGATDLLGNVEEWTYVKSGEAAPVFGGHWATPFAELRAEASEPVDFREQSPQRGFRVMLLPKQE